MNSGQSKTDCKQTWVLKAQSYPWDLKTGWSTCQNYTSPVQTRLCGFDIQPRGKHFSWVESASQKRSILKLIFELRTDRFSHAIVTCFIIWSLNRMLRLCDYLNTYAKRIWPQVCCKLHPSGMADQECTVSTAPFPPPRLLDGVLLAVCVCMWVCMNTLLGLP